MLVEVAITPLGRGTHVSEDIAEAVRVIDASGWPYELTPSATVIEGDWDAVIPIVRRAHEKVRERSPHVVTTIRIEDEEGARDQIRRYVTSVEEKVGHRLERIPA